MRFAWTTNRIPGCAEEDGGVDSHLRRNDGKLEIGAYLPKLRKKLHIQYFA